MRGPPAHGLPAAAGTTSGTPMKDPDVIEVVQEAAPAEVAELDLYQKREKIYTRKI